VGGSATSLRSLAGDRLHPDAVARAMELLTRGPAAELARATGLDPQRIRLLPAGLLILEVVAERFGTAPAVGSGGIREGVLLEAEASAHQ
jgi:exopolyphosphatase / guanosine-5'-triphosphate,3'-diphosphate pyrophosphatase